MKKLVISVIFFSFFFQADASPLVSGVFHPTNRRASAKVIPASYSAEPGVEVGFSPEGSAEALVMKVINSAQSEIRVMAYEFTSSSIARALISAKRRGVNVMVIADAKSNLESQYGTKALSAMVEAGITVKTIDQYPVFHDKVMIVDRMHLETGSFNYTNYAAKKNSENAIVMWNSPDIVAPYLQHWNARWPQGKTFRQSY